MTQIIDTMYEEPTASGTLLRAHILCDTAADLPTPNAYTGYTLLMGSIAEDISTGDRYKMQSDGTWRLQPAAWDTLYTVTGVPPLSFSAHGLPLLCMSVKGNGQQNGTPTPAIPIMPDFVGTLDSTDWTIPIICAGQTVHLYLGLHSTVRRVRKLVLTGEEEWTYITGGKHWTPVTGYQKSGLMCMCTHYESVENSSGSAFVTNGQVGFYSSAADRLMICDTNYTTTENWKQYLAVQYAAGTPVVVWYVLAEPETGIVNDPLCKIGVYADTLIIGPGIIPTAEGSNTLIVDTTLQPSKVTITYK